MKSPAIYFYPGSVPLAHGLNGAAEGYALAVRMDAFGRTSYQYREFGITIGKILWGFGASNYIKTYGIMVLS